MGRGRQACFAAVTLLGSTALSLAAAELVLDGWLDHQRRRAKAELDYDATHRAELGPGGRGLPGFSGRVRDGLGGTVRWTNEAHGFRNERDATPVPAPGVLRVLSLGDSFAAGYRVGQDDTYSRRLEAWASERFGPTEVLVANIESPPRGVDWLERWGWAWAPDLVLMGVTLGNDVASSWIALHPGPITPAEVEALELPAHAWSPRPVSPLRVWLGERSIVQVLRGRREAIGTSYNDAVTPRLFDGINGLGVFLRDPPPEIESAWDRLFAVLARFEAACLAHRVPCAALVFPQRFQIDARDWELAIARYGLAPEAFDLRAPNRRIAEFCAGRALVCIDPTEPMAAWHAERGEELYLPRGDMHWNAAGHRVFLEAAQPALAERIAAARARRGLD
jgi:hypothetical protein